ncbi:MAG: hypothetical protein WA828_16000 [Coleofasciculaceae cyanobacterium]
MSISLNFKVKSDRFAQAPKSLSLAREIVQDFRARSLYEWHPQPLCPQPAPLG